MTMPKRFPNEARYGKWAGQFPPIDPPDEPAECLWCDGQCQVTLHAILDVCNQVQTVWSLPNATNMEVDCPRCDGTGAEPAPDPLADPRIP